MLDLIMISVSDRPDPVESQILSLDAVAHLAVSSMPANCQLIVGASGVCAATYEARIKGGKPVDEVILHGGDVHDHDKITVMQRLHCWRANEWKSKVGKALIQKVSLLLQLPGCIVYSSWSGNDFKLRCSSLDHVRSCSPLSPLFPTPY